ncbi:hypothetical protein CY35_08G007200 [Sphagnum magellanicum]|nr:hypothetical protein CY35_08G007200 [Sphagnum magellanicum]
MLQLARWWFVFLVLGTVVVLAWTVQAGAGAAAAAAGGAEEKVEKKKTSGGVAGGKEADHGNQRREVYMVLVVGEPVVAYKGGLPGLTGTAELFMTRRWRKSRHHRAANATDLVHKYTTYLKRKQDELLDNFFKKSSSNSSSRPSYTKLYSYHHIVNGFAVELTAEEAELLAKDPGVVQVEKSYRVQKATVHTPYYLQLPQGIWAQEGGYLGAGENIVIGLVDTGIDPTHPSFSTLGQKPYGPLTSYQGKCEVAPEFPLGSCNGKIIGAQHFAAAASKDGVFNATLYFASPLDGDGHGSHTASTAAGNHGVPVTVNGAFYGNASGMAPRARIAVYKALYRLIGGFIPDVIAACDQAVADGVDILSLSLGPNSPPGGSISTFLNILDVALLNAVKANVLVVQAAGNGGPYDQTVTSFSPWIITVGAGVDDRSYPNTLTLGNTTVLPGTLLAPPTKGPFLYNLISANDATQGPGNPLYTPSDCQLASLFNKLLVQGKLMICTYSFNFIFGGASMRQVVLLDYYSRLTTRDANGIAVRFGAQAKIGGGQIANYSGQAQQVALFSSRGPDIKDFNFNQADILKPNVLAPGYLIWGAWTPIGIDNPDYIGQRWAMISGTSMATPHVAGLAALLKEKYPLWSPAALASAMVTTADVQDSRGVPLQAQEVSAGSTPLLQNATPFDMGGGALNVNAALNPGIIFDAGEADYVAFLCTAEGATPQQVFASTGGVCPTVPGRPIDLNTPSITLASLNGTQVLSRTVTNIASNVERYTITWTSPADVAVTITPVTFTIGSSGQLQSQRITFTLQATGASTLSSFGQVTFAGDLGHQIHIPISITNKSLK